MNATAKLAFSLALIATSLLTQTASAHFPWLATDDEHHALLFFSENPAERDYHLPEAVLKAKVTQQLGEKPPVEVKMNETDEEAFVGLRSVNPVDPAATLSTAVQYGNYHGTLLNYYAKHVGQLPVGGDQKPVGKRPPLDATPVVTGKGLCLTVLWKGKPLAGADVTLMAAGAEPAQVATDEDGEAWFPVPPVGSIAAIIGHKTDSAGEVDGKSYTSVTSYATLTFQNVLPPQNAAKQESATKASEKTSALPALPEPIASFGGAVANGWLYVYSGHIGKAHAHSRDNLSKGFQRLKLDGGKQWQPLPCDRPLQGLAVVAHGGKIYRVGGLEARNAAGAEEQLHSVADFSVFDPASETWTALPSLPAARSSLDAVVIGDVLYVAGGWQLSGDDNGKWQSDVLAYDLSQADSSQPNAQWQTITKLPINKRAIAAAQWHGQLVVLGGMGEDHSISRRVDAFDPVAGEWSKLADFPGKGMDGFGMSAWNLNGKVYASGTEGVIYELADDGQSWKRVAELERPRFFHRILPGQGNTLLVVAGSSLEDGHLADIEKIAIKPQ